MFHVLLPLAFERVKIKMHLWSALEVNSLHKFNSFTLFPIIIVLSHFSFGWFGYVADSV